VKQWESFPLQCFRYPPFLVKRVTALLGVIKKVTQPGVVVFIFRIRNSNLVVGMSNKKLQRGTAAALLICHISQHLYMDLDLPELAAQPPTAADQWRQPC
jgi:hypothetical protein